MSEKIKCVRVGYGNIFNLHENKLALCGVETAGVVDINPAKVEKAVENGYVASETVSGMPVSPDMWDVCTPNDQHLVTLKEILAVDPKYKGKGFASKLLRPMLERFDYEKIICSLETTNPIDIKMYEHFGFRLLKKISLPVIDLPMWEMVREPKI